MHPSSSADNYMELLNPVQEYITIQETKKKREDRRCRERGIMSQAPIMMAPIFISVCKLYLPLRAQCPLATCHSLYAKADQSTLCTLEIAKPLQLILSLCSADSCRLPPNTYSVRINHILIVSQ